MSAFAPGSRIPGTRWTVVGESTPMLFSGTSRKMIRVRCVCGFERTHRVDRFHTGDVHSMGCRSQRCFAIHKVAESIRATGFPITMAEFEARISELCAESRARGDDGAEF